MATAMEPHPVTGAVSPEAIASYRAYQARCRDLSAAAGVLNATHGVLVDVAAECLAEGDHLGPGLLSFSQFFALRTGVSPTVAGQVEKLAKRRDELPVLVAALQAGEISLDQAAVVAINVPAEYDASATQYAKVATVTQLKAVLPAYRTKRGRKARGAHLSFTELDDGSVRVSGVLGPAEGALVRKANEAMRDDLWRQRHDDAKTAAEESGEPENPVEAPTNVDAFAAMAETALAAGQAAHPSSDRYLVSYHLQATPDGRTLLIDDRGNVVGDDERRRILCDHSFECVDHDESGTPLSVGRKTRHINRKLRRAILHRHRCRCAVPGCDARLGLEIHHIWHWEDGGPTCTWNLVPLCHHHHSAHHTGELHIEGNADLPAGTPGALVFGPPGQPLTGAASPTPVDASIGDHENPLGFLRNETHDRLGVTPPTAASTPTGERLNRHDFHLHPQPPISAPADGTDADGEEPSEPADEQAPVNPRRRHHRPPAGSRSPDGPPEANGPPAT